MDQKYYIQSTDQIPSPSLIVYLELVKDNIKQAVEMVQGRTEKLRPHVKTHKTARIVELELAAGIYKHKCATLVEAQMLAEVGVTDVLIAYQMVGPNIQRFVDLMNQFPEVDFQLVVDHPIAIQALSKAIQGVNKSVKVMLDFNVGMNRTGITLADGAVDLYRQIQQADGLRPWGLHVYDGHIHHSSLTERRSACQYSLDQVEIFKQQIGEKHLPNLVMGGTPTFPIYAEISDVETSPGTFVFSDYNYSKKYPDLGFVPAALLLSRIISLPIEGHATLDLGHKAISADSKDPRGKILNLDGSKLSAQHEEHWSVKIRPSDNVLLGQSVFVCPAHICPTVALHQFCYIVDERGMCIDRWEVSARHRN